MAPWKSGASAPRQQDKSIGLQPLRGPIRTYNLCFLGYGNVNRTLVRLLEDRAEELRTRHGIAYRITGIASRSLGWIADSNGLDPNANLRTRQPESKNVREWLAAAQADVLFEATSLNVKDGE